MLRAAARVMGYILASAVKDDVKVSTMMDMIKPFVDELYLTAFTRYGQRHGMEQAIKEVGEILGRSDAEEALIRKIRESNGRQEDDTAGNAGEV